MKLVLLLASLISSVASAGQETGTVTFHHGQYASNASSAGMTFFVLEGGAKLNIPGCATVMGGQRWVINNNWPAAKMQVNALLLAAVTGKQVTVRGSDNCSVWSDSETAVDVFLAE